MRWGIVLVVALCGCNEVFALHDTQLVDAAPVKRDTMLDAAVTCPPTGMPPKFSRALTQVLTQNCSSFSASTATGISLAICYEPVTNVQHVEEGQLDRDLVVARGFPEYPEAYVYATHLTPEGGEVYASVYDYVTFQTTFRAYDRQGDGSWAATGDLPFPYATVPVLSGPSRGPARHVLAASYNGQLDEYVLDPTAGWMLQRSQSPAETGLTYLSSVNLSGDALRVLIYGLPVGTSTYEILYADRPSPDVPFSPLSSAGLPQITEAFLTEDCGRIYFPALGSIFYATLQND